MKKKLHLKSAGTYFAVKVAVNLMLIVLGAVFISWFLRDMQQKVSQARQREDSEAALSEVIETLSTNANDVDDLSYIFHSGNQETVADLRALLTSGLFDSIGTLDEDARCKVFADVVDRSGVSYLLVIDEKGTILLAPSADYCQKSLTELGLMTDENLAALLAGTKAENGEITPVQETNSTGSYYFYSDIMDFGDQHYVLVLGADQSMLDIQLESLRDVGSILRRAAISNDGFMFAVNTRRQTFLYYENGDDVLTGQSIEGSGLTDAALEDGYSGIQMINGISYYCVSRTFKRNTVVCAVADTEHVYSTDRYVVFWSVLGFVLVMLLSLNYAVIVRNDCVRKETPVKKTKLLNTKTGGVFFNRTVFRKVVPLMVAGVLIIFVISFYSQTLLDISEAIASSEVALEDITGRYAQSSDNRTVILNYYNNHYLAKARLLAYLLEEDPSALNEETDRYYSTYDESGTKHYLTDDEGNRLRSVSESQILAKLCASNDIDKMYLFDEDGHVIATNSNQWYFILSHEETDQSNQFYDVIDGKLDELVQDAMTDDQGNTSQYIGVEFHYYTTTDATGATKYVSRYDYQNSLTDPEATPVTEHRSLLQISLKSEITQRLLASTDVSYILSSDTLSGGFVMLFDTSDEHRVVYSPNTASIGKTAAEIGITDKAFSGSYYGFQTANGTDYFQYYVYNDGYYIATAIPTSTMYQSRWPVALVTGLASLIMILILSATVTITTEEEERLYREAGKSTDEKQSLNAAFFNIVMPSGRTNSTMSAAARWDNRRVPWREKNPSQKLMVLLALFFTVLFGYVLLSVLMARSLFSEHSIILYILGGQWDRGLNIFAISAAGATLLFTGLCVSLVRVPVRLITSLLGARSETIGHLLLSVVKYGGWLGSLFYCLYLLGQDSSSLLASAGILSLVIGLGAQSLIQDILAGIFIVFEGEFRVGDIVTVGDFRGQVMDIGLRTTKLLNPSGNTKIYNNSDIKSVLNMTKAASIAVCKIGIEYGEDLEHAEEVLRAVLPELAKNCREILETPAYLGVAELAESSVVLQVIAKCHENDIYTVQRVMNREILLAFRKNNVNVAFPSLSIYPPDEKYGLRWDLRNSGKEKE